MANNDRCVFCGEKVGSFRSTNVLCGSTYQLSCKSCEKEMNHLDHTERCRRALQRGLASRPELLREYIEVTQSAEDHRPTCGCGGKLRFMEEQNFDNTPHGDSIFHGCFTVLPGYCTTCGRFAFFHPETVRSNPFLAHLIEKDTGRT
jgi:hypothetical protein